ncbi:hypothetical protein NEUTE1DRAFT_101204 [Neurospora tetrasperma FGSC 2508]|uniref:Uncharacterized protein n=1 Tax=Neurospora tetrasperma (strain FGSC 2508 / ATCC MYA-4615 / P0657) TaxID=510951 RepID=F8ML12_NEUT8|nr:uncharacterized protein NEUTE1DRAFT_101204 [Neurospora tetrasperma FGSC 2508]EGO58337.1 hypothetical protein NEUTE1DRAFT_101204 [Neurospora tetrasperma FGSC 2508]EGZ71340.1 hypothetical protein NEUTE2DRAFT_128735 [Neurospora tetrasperma FGSC 2509]
MEVSVLCDQIRPCYIKLFGFSDRDVGGFGEGYAKPSLLSAGSTTLNLSLALNDESEVKDGYCQRLSMLVLAFEAAVGWHGLASAALGGECLTLLGSVASSRRLADLLVNVSIINMIQHITTPGNID